MDKVVFEFVGVVCDGVLRLLLLGTPPPSLTSLDSRLDSRLDETAFALDEEEFEPRLAGKLGSSF